VKSVGSARRAGTAGRGSLWREYEITVIRAIEARSLSYLGMMKNLICRHRFTQSTKAPKTQGRREGVA
jgi:hypothetical protein